MLQPDSRILRNTILKHLKQKILIISILIENQWNVPLSLNLYKQMGGHKTSLISFERSPFINVHRI